MTNIRQEKRGVGYFETVFSAVELPTMAEALKQFALECQITADSEEGEVLDHFVGTLIKTIDLDQFQAVAPQLFSYPKQVKGELEVEGLNASEEELNYLKRHIDSLLQSEIEVIQ